MVNWKGQVLLGGREQGEWKYYHPDGKLNKSGHYNHAEKEGEWKWYHENGKLRSKFFYKRNEEDGDYKSHYENGNLNGLVLSRQGRMGNGRSTMKMDS